MNEQHIDKIIASHCRRIRKVHKDKNIAQIIKSIDGIVQNMYTEIYALRDGRKLLARIESNKKGHCC